MLIFSDGKFLCNELWPGFDFFRLDSTHQLVCNVEENMALWDLKNNYFLALYYTMTMYILYTILSKSDSREF